MSTTEKQFEDFYENIKLTKNQREDVKTKYDGVCKKLHDTYYPNIAYTGNTKLLIGSYGKHTNIRPARDVDVVFIMPPEKFDQYNDNTSNKQSQLLQNIKSILEEKYINTPISAFGKIVKLEFADTKHDVELVPAWENSNGTFTIPNSENGGSWEVCDYRKEISEILNSDAQTGRTKFLIRCVKKWSDQCTAQASSYKIEQSILSFLQSRDISRHTSSLLMKDFFEYFLLITSNYNLKSHLTTAVNRIQKAYSFESNGKINEATEEWKKVFGNDFPNNTNTIKNATSLELLQRKYPSTMEQFLDKDFNIPFEIDSRYKVVLDSEIKDQKGFRDSLLSVFLANKLPVQKKKSLLFFIKHNVVAPYDIMWKVRNFGEEANLVDGGLRGEIINDLGGETRKESTSYEGEHYVECYFIKERKCVAIGRVFVPIGKNY